MASTGIIQRRYAKHELIANPPLIGEVVFALDTEEFGTLIDSVVVWKKFDDIIKSVNGQHGHVMITKEDLGLGDVDNTSDIDKPVSTATQILHDSHYTESNPHNVDANMIGLGDVDNTSDVDKPISDATVIALMNKLGILETAVNSERLGGFLPEHFVRAGDVYTKPESIDFLAHKANLSDIYSKIIIDGMMADKADKDNIYEKDESDATFQKLNQKGVAQGYAGLGLDGKVPEGQLPTSVTGQSIVEVANELSLPNVGESNTIYVTLDSNSMFIYDVNTSTYQNVSTAIGETQGTAFRGDHGVLAYDHISNTENPHEVTALQTGAYSKTEMNVIVNAHISSNNPHNITPEVLNVYEKEVLDHHKSDKENPHEVSASQVGSYTIAEIDTLFGEIADLDAAGEYTRVTPTDVEVGGVPVGSTFEGSIQDALDKIFYLYPLPAFDDFTIEGIDNPKEYDTTITAGTYTATWNITSSQNLKPDTITIKHGVDNLGTNLPNTATADIVIPTDITSNVEKIERFEISALNTRDEPFSLFYDIQWITPTDSDTVVNNDTALTDEDVPVDIDVLANDTDNDGPVSTVASVTQPQNGTALINPDGTVKYTPNPDYNGVDSFTYTNEQGGVGVISINVAAISDLTNTINDSAVTNEDTAVDINVTSNDEDPDGVVADVLSVTQPSNGSVSINTDNTIKYTPNVNFNGTDVFTYTNTDGNTGTVNVIINSVNDLTTVVNNSATTIEDTVVNIDVLTNDIDVDGDKSPVASVSQPSNGVSSINSDGTVQYMPELDFNGTDIFTYTNAEGNAGVVTVTVTSVEDLTTVNDDNFNTLEDTIIDMDVLANDYDPEGNKSVVESVTQPLNGTTSINPDGTVRYAPNVGFNGTDTFIYTNTEGNSGTINVTIQEVNDPTVIVNDDVTIDEDEIIDIDVLANDTDTDAKSVPQSVTQPNNGGVSINVDNTIKYTPNLDFYGTDIFTYTNTEGNTGTVTVTVNAVDDITVVVDDTVEVQEDVITDLDVLGNDTDVDGPVSIVESVTQPAHGSVSINANNTIKYIPEENFNGVTSFAYTNEEGTVGTVTINVLPVNDMTVVVDDTATTDENSIIDIDVIANDTDVDEKSIPNSLTQPANGSASINANGTIRYVPNNNFSGTDTFTYTNVEGTTGNVVVTVNEIGNLTVVNNDTAVTNEEQPINIDVLENDTDSDGVKSEVVSVAPGTNGSVAINTDGTVKYTPNTDFAGVDTFTYTNAEGTIGSVTVTVNEVDDITSVVDDTVTTSEDNYLDIDVLANDIDVDSKSPVSTITQPSHGTAYVNPDGTIKYIPADDFNGVDSFTYTNEQGSSGNITVNVTAVDDVTVVVNDTATVQQDAAVNINVTSNDTDIDSVVSSVDTVTQGANGTVSINPDNTVKYTPNAGYYGTDTFTYTNVDGIVGTVDITIDQYQGTPMYYGVWEYNTPALTIDELNSVDFTSDNTKIAVDGTYSFNAKAYDDEDPDYVEGSNNGLGAYHTIVYPASFDVMEHMIDTSNSTEAAWQHDADITINGTLYKVARTTYEQWAGDWSYDVT